ncbi:hypothetical protein BASA81_007111 [Batrachochytrium salamandrivorans]|nr:hypothetical protein BASA81_007111 [Batrachochytrium salamandrivorans]
MRPQAQRPVSHPRFLEFDVVTEISDPDSESGIKYRLQVEFGLPSRQAELCADKRYGDWNRLLAYKLAGGESTWDSPLILLSVDFADFFSQAYFHLGNYNLPEGCPGALSLPNRSAESGHYPAWVTEGPSAMGKFLALGRPGVVDVSGGRYTLLKFPSLAVLREAGAAIQNMAQFQRIGPKAARSMQVDAQEELVTVFAFDFARGEALYMRHFHQTE